MPTGYTAIIGDENTSFQDFVIGCSTAFIGNDGLRRYQDDVEYYKQCLSETQVEIEHFKNMTGSERIEFGTSIISVETNIIQTKFNDLTVLLERYNRMLEEVKNWEPGEGFEDFKSFMINQLVTSIKADDIRSYYIEELKILGNKKPLEYYESRKSLAQANLDYYKECFEEAKTKLKNKTEFVEKLYSNLGVEIPKETN